MRCYTAIIQPHFSTFLFGVIFLCDFVHAVTISPPPMNVTVVTGSNINLTCGLQGNFSNALAWEVLQGLRSWYRIYTINNNNPSWNAGFGPPRFQILNPFGLGINNISVSDGSLYRCFLPIESNFGSAVVTVTDVPVVSVPSTMDIGTAVNLSCSVKFGGPDQESYGVSQFPKLTMTIGNSSVNDTVAPVITVVQSNVNLNDQKIYYLSKSVNHTVVTADAGATVQCSVSTFNPNFTSFSSAVLNVRLPARITQITPEKSSFSVNENVSCLASGVPQPSVNWTAVITPVKTYTAPSGGVLTIQDGMIGYNVWNCTASNAIGYDVRQITFNVTDAVVGADSSQDNLKIGLGVGLGVGIPVLIIIIVIIVCCALYCCRRNKSPVGKADRQLQQPVSSPVNSFGNHPQLNNEPLSANSSPPPEYNPRSPASPVHTAVNVKSNADLSIKNHKKGNPLTGYGALSPENLSANDITLKKMNNEDVSVSVSNTNPKAADVSQTANVPDVGGDLGGYINLSYNGDDINSNFDEDWQRNGRPKPFVEPVGLDMNFSALPPRDMLSDLSISSENNRPFTDYSTAPLQSSAPVPQPRRSLNSYTDAYEPPAYIPDEFDRYPAGRLTTPVEYYDGAIERRRFSPTGRNDPYYESSGLGMPGPPYYDDMKPLDISHQPVGRSRPFSPARGEVSYGLVNNSDPTFVEPAFDNVGRFDSPVDSSYHSNQILQILGASRSVDV